MSMTHREAQRTIQSARSRSAGKPIQNNTRLYDRPGGDFGVVLHGTEVVTIHTDGTYTLRSGGYRTPTTADRIHRYSPAKQFSEKGEWYVWMKPVDRDPRPAKVERSIPRPFTPGDHMGPEPIKGTEGCKAGQLIATEHVDELVEIWRKDMKEDDNLIEVISDGYEPGGDYDKVSVKRTWTDHVYYSEGRYWDEGWAKLPDNHNAHSKSFVNDDGERVKKIQCPHCAEFERIHEVWSAWYHGKRYAAIDQRKGFKLYREMMDRFHNDKDLWQQAYIEDFRARRAYNEADRAWELRNRVPFFDGIQVDNEGYAHRIRQQGPSPAKLRRHEREVVRMQKRIEKYLDGYIKTLVKGMPMPSGGDCRYCSMVTQDGRTMGDAANVLNPDGSVTVQANPSHLISHMEERYYVPTLAVNAMRESARLTDTGIYLWLDMNQDTHTMGGKPQSNKPYDNVKRAIRKYMVKRLVPEAPTS